MGLHPSRQGVHVLRHSPRLRSKLRRATYTRTGNRSRRLTCNCTSREVRSCRSPPRLRAHGHRAQARTSCPTGKHTIPSRQYFAGKYHPSLPEDRRESRVLDSFRRTDQMSRQMTWFPQKRQESYNAWPLLCIEIRSEEVRFTQPCQPPPL